MAVQTHVGSILRGKDIFLCHTGADKSWVENLAEMIERVPYQDRHLGVVFDKWDFEKGKNFVLEIDSHIDQCRFIGVVVSKAMLAAEWPPWSAQLPCVPILQADRAACFLSSLKTLTCQRVCGFAVG